jgi:hypothetical protein
LLVYVLLLSIYSQIIILSEMVKSKEKTDFLPSGKF